MNDIHNPYKFIKLFIFIAIDKSQEIPPISHSLKYKC